MSIDGLPNRHSIRLKNFDYRCLGVYFVTMCVSGRQCVFGDVVQGEMVPNAAGRIVGQEWLRTANLRAEIALDEFVVMPNHFHGLVIIRETRLVGAHGDAPVEPEPITSPAVRLRRLPLSLGAAIAGFKRASTKRVNELWNTPARRLWQRGFFDRIVLTDTAFEAARRYITANPRNWQLDINNPSRFPVERS